MTLTQREEFDAWYATQFWADCYSDVRDQLFVAWQAGRAAAVVTAPDKCEFADASSDYAKGYRQGLRAYRDAIDAAGLKVKA